VAIPETLLSRADDLYLLGDAGARLLQAIGMVDGVAAQTHRYQTQAVTAQGVQVPGMIPDREQDLGKQRQHVEALPCQLGRSY
jgi:hypothetical protein